MQAYGKAELGRGNVVAAEELFLRQKELVQSMLRSCEDQDPVRAQTLRDTITSQWLTESVSYDKELADGTGSELSERSADVQTDRERRRETLNKVLLFAISSLRQICKQKGDCETFASLARELQVVKTALKTQECAAATPGTESDANEPLHPLVARGVKLLSDARNSVRQLCVCISASRKLGEGCRGSTPGLSDTVQESLSAASAQVQTCRRQLDAIRRSESLEPVEEMCETAARLEGQVLPTLQRFRTHELDGEECARELFSACDAVRADLRNLGAQVDR